MCIDHACRLSFLLQYTVVQSFDATANLKLCVMLCSSLKAAECFGTATLQPRIIWDKAHVGDMDHCIATSAVHGLLVALARL